MRNKNRLLIIVCLVFLPFDTVISESKKELDALSKLPYSKNIKKSLETGEMYSNANVASFKKKFRGKNYEFQKLDFSSAGIHPKKCSQALRKISQYEQYSKYIGFVKASSYDAKSQRVNFKLSALILPFSMTLNFKLPRISKPGVYQYTFDRGFLKGLTGKIHVSKYKNKCLFYSAANWSGTHTGISNTLLEFFTGSLGKLALGNLFRISR